MPHPESETLAILKLLDAGAAGPLGKVCFPVPGGFLLSQMESFLTLSLFPRAEVVSPGEI